MAIRHFRSWFKVSAGLVIALLATMGVVLAVSAHVGGVSPGVIHSCVNSKSGELKIAGATDTCKPKDKDKEDKEDKSQWAPVDWNAVGPIGPTGPTGAPGAPGAKGDKGDTGAPGFLSGSSIVIGTTVTSAHGTGAGVSVTSTATCAGGKVLLGGGGTVIATSTTSPLFPTPEKVMLAKSYPSSTTTWTAVGVNNANLSGSSTTGDTFSVTAYALCSL